LINLELNDVQTSVSIIQEYSKNKNGLDEEELLALVNVILAQKLTFSIDFYFSISQFKYFGNKNNS